MKTEIELLKEWMAEAKEQTPDTFQAFFDRLVAHDHDYGTVCRAMAAIGVAAMTAFNKSSAGGITGFQASCVMWDVIEGWGTCEEGPKRLVQFRNMLYPQYEYRFEKTISAESWAWLQEEAKKALLDDPDLKHPRVREHQQSIADGQVPFGYTVTDD